MQIVKAEEDHRKEGFSAAVELSSSDIENIEKLLDAGDEEAVKTEIQKIIDFARQEGKGKPLIDDGEGEAILIEIDGIQVDLAADVDELKDMLPCF
jgi:hypothetical protein